LSNLSNVSFFAQADIRTIASVQLDHGGKAIGILLAFVTGEIRAFSEQELDLMQGVAHQASMALANALLFQQVQAGHARLLRLGQRLVTAQEEERQRLAHELHDAAGQTLTALKFSLSLLCHDLLIENQQLEDASPQERLDDAIQLVDEVMDQIRLLSHGLLPFSVEIISLNEALGDLCHDFSMRTQLPIAYSGCEAPPLSTVVQLSFYRFLQEALTNIARHAGASQVRVTLTLDDNHLSLIVADDGRGFNTESATMASDRPPGIGLVGMRERFAFLGGEVEVESEPGRGTRITTRYPLPGD
jgi:signal transduction histidine kinase